MNIILVAVSPVKLIIFKACSLTALIENRSSWSSPWSDCNFNSGSPPSLLAFILIDGLEPSTCNFSFGLSVPIPTLPVLSTDILSVTEPPVACVKKTNLAASFAPSLIACIAAAESPSLAKFISANSASDVFLPSN